MTSIFKKSHQLYMRMAAVSVARRQFAVREDKRQAGVDVLGLLVLLAHRRGVSERKTRARGPPRHGKRTPIVPNSEMCCSGLSCFTLRLSQLVHYHADITINYEAVCTKKQRLHSQNTTQTRLCGTGFLGGVND